MLRTLFTAFIRVACFFIVIASGHVLAQEPVPLVDRARGAERVVVGRVTAVNPVWQTNEFGDRLIVSIVSVAVDETLRGPSQAAVDVEVEGGTVPHLRHAPGALCHDSCARPRALAGHERLHDERGNLGTVSSAVFD